MVSHLNSTYLKPSKHLKMYVMKKFNQILCILMVCIPVFFSSSCKKDDTAPLTIEDIDGNSYTLVNIGEQVWLLENLKTNRYRNGDKIPFIQEGDATWTFIPAGAMGNYENSNTLREIYGSLYNWYAIADGRGICPTGYHVASDADWLELTDFLGGASVAGAKLKESGTTHWKAPNIASNESHFTALPAGFRPTAPFSQDTTVVAWFWSTNSISGSTANSHRMLFNEEDVKQFEIDKNYGFPCRCLMD